MNHKKNSVGANASTDRSNCILLVGDPVKGSPLLNSSYRIAMLILVLGNEFPFRMIPITVLLSTFNNINLISNENIRD